MNSKDVLKRYPNIIPANRLLHPEHGRACGKVSKNNNIANAVKPLAGQQVARQGNHTATPATAPQNANNGGYRASVGNGYKSAIARPKQPYHARNQRQKADLDRLPPPVDFYGRFLSLKGNGQWRLALCPFHQDKRPSLSINSVHGGYICHTCGAKGDRIRFYMDFMGVDFVQACKDLGLYDK